MPAEMLRALPAIRRDPLRFLEGTVRRYGDLVAFPLPRTPVLLINTVAGSRRVLVENSAAYSKRTVQYGALSLVTGEGLLTADGARWRRRRRLDQPAFHHSRLPQVAAQSAVAAERLAAAVPSAGGVLDVDAAALEATLEVVGRVLFGGEVADDGRRVVAAVLDSLEVVVARARTPVPVPSWAPTRGNRRLRRSVELLDAACADLVAHRRAARGSGGDEGQADGEDDDLLGLLLRAADAGSLTAAEVRDEIVTMVIAGHETVASSLAWTLHLLAQHPDQQRRLHAELDEVLTGPPQWEDLVRLPVTRATVDESLRLFPPAWVLTRRAEEADEVDGVAVPAGTLAILSPWLLHRRPEVFPEPDSFAPQRFLPGAPPVPRGAYVPFGAGPRLCIGRDFALVESVLVLAALLRRHVVLPVSSRPPAVEALVTLRPRGGLPLRVLPRQGLSRASTASATRR